MKTAEQIEKVIQNVLSTTEYPGMSYEDGIREALEWVLGDISDEEFPYGQD